MDVGALAGSMTRSNTAAAVSTGVMKDAQSLEMDLVGRLFSSLGIGNGVDAYA